MLRSRGIMFVLACWLAGSVAVARPPVIYWKCDPAGPDETLMLFGDGLGPQSRLVVSRLPDVEPGAPEAAGKLPAGEEQEIKPLQVDGQCIKLVMPAEWQWGCYTVRVQMTAGALRGRHDARRPEVVLVVAARQVCERAATAVSPRT